MLARSESKATRWILLGLVVTGMARVLLTPEDGASPSILPGLVCLVVGTGVSILGCTIYARGKGQDAWFGLAGIFGFIGLLGLLFMTDNYKCCKKGGESCTHGREKKQDWSSRAA
jgi:hypothetical protein